MRLRRPGFPLVLVAGVLLLQAAWVVTLPPFRGIDEIDHVYRVASVAEGQWRPTTPAADGRGLEVTIPEPVVDAASAQCEALLYTGPDNCRPARRPAEGMAVVATAAGAYSPVYYVALAPAALVLDGAAVDYGARVLNGLLMLLGLWAAAWCLVRDGGRTWTRLALVVALTPVFVYSTVLPAPNGLEMVAGLAVWAAFIALLGPGATPRPDGRVLAVLAVSGCALAMTRMLGPLWCVLVLASVLAFFGWSRVADVVRARPVGAGVVVASVLGGGVVNAWWTVSAGLLGRSPDVEPDEVGNAVELGSKPVLWLLQVVAAFPTWIERAHPLVYTNVVVVFTALLLAGMLASSGRGRAVLLAVLAVVVVAPVVITLATAASQGVIWQGRYGLAYAVGLPLLAGTALDRRWPSPRGPARLVALAAVAVLAIAHALSVVGVRLHVGKDPVSTGDPAWLEPSPVLLVALTVVAFTLIGLGVVRGGTPDRDLRQERHGQRDSRGADGGLRRGGPPAPARGARERQAADTSS